MRAARPAAAQLRAPLPVRSITPAEIQARLSHRLRQIVGPGRRVTLAEAAKLTGINARTLKAYVAGTACPNVARYGRLLREGETLSEFVEQSVRIAVQRRVHQGEFIARGIASLDRAREANEYINADTVIAGLQRKLDSARTKQAKSRR